MIYAALGTFALYSFLREASANTRVDFRDSPFLWAIFLLTLSVGGAILFGESWYYGFSVMGGVLLIDWLLTH